MTAPEPLATAPAPSPAPAARAPFRVRPAVWSFLAALLAVLLVVQLRQTGDFPLAVARAWGGWLTAVAFGWVAGWAAWKLFGRRWPGAATATLLLVATGFGGLSLEPAAPPYPDDLLITEPLPPPPHPDRARPEAKAVGEVPWLDLYRPPQAPDNVWQAPPWWPSVLAAVAPEAAPAIAERLAGQRAEMQRTIAALATEYAAASADPASGTAAESLRQAIVEIAEAVNNARRVLLNERLHLRQRREILPEADATRLLAQRLGLLDELLRSWEAETGAWDRWANAHLEPELAAVYRAAQIDEARADLARAQQRTVGLQRVLPP